MSQPQGGKRNSKLTALSVDAWKEGMVEVETRDYSKL